MKLLNAIKEVTSPSTCQVIASVFACMEIAEELIAAKLDSICDENIPPDDELTRSERVDASFAHLRPRMPLPTRLYREHCKEIIDCCADDKPVPIRTNAEVMMLIREFSLATPITRPLQCAYALLFERSFPDEYADIASTSDVEFDTYEIRKANELIAQLRKEQELDEFLQPSKHSSRSQPQLTKQGITDFLRVD